ncbi:hypothetical protein D3C72_1563130 [compost metagenome]
MLDVVWAFLEADRRKSIIQMMNRAHRIANSSITSDCFHTAYARADAGFRNNFEHANLRSVLNVSTTAKFSREITHSQNTNFIAVFFAEQSHGTFSDRLFWIHQLRLHRQAASDLFVHHVFDLLNFFRRNRFVVSEVKTSFL